VANRNEIFADEEVRDNNGTTFKNVTGQTVGRRRALNTYELNRTEKTAFDELVIAEKQVLIELKSAVNDISVLRNVTEVTGSATVALANSEYRLRTTASAGDTAKLTSAEKGRYVPGYQAECGVGIRLGSVADYTGDMDSKWGYFDDNNGYFFGYDALGFYVGIRRGGVDTKTYQADFENDSVDGQGDSAYTLDPESGNVFEIDYVWYGYGSIRFYVIAKNADFILGTKKILMHTIIPDGETSIQQPNLPINVELTNGTEAVATDVYVGGRQYSIYGGYNPIFRLTGDFRANVTLSTTFQPLISFRRKTASIFQNQIAQFDDLQLHTTGDIIISFVVNGTLTGASWGTPTNHTATETILESDTSATAITGGTFTGGFYSVPGGQGNTQIAGNVSDKVTDLINSQPFTLVARAVTGTPTLDVCTMNIKEEW